MHGSLVKSHPCNYGRGKPAVQGVYWFVTELRPTFGIFLEFVTDETAWSTKYV